ELVVNIQLRPQPARVRQARDADDLLHAEPQRLAILEEQRQPRADADAPVRVEVTAMRLEKLAPPADVFLQRHQIVDGQGSHAASLRSELCSGTISCS